MKLYRLCVGLGNPGPQYSQNRHNAGFMLMDALREIASTDRPWQDHPLFWLCTIEDPFPAYLLKPKTYMNLSGQAVAAFLETRPVALEHRVICYDDLALPLGALRWRGKGSSGGQKGMEHIIQTLGTSQLVRLRLGIGSPQPPKTVTEFVLGDFCPEEGRIFKKLMGMALNSLVCWADHGLSIVMSRFNGINFIDPDHENREE